MSSELIAYISLICMSGVLNLYLCINVFLKRHQYSNIADIFVLYTTSITIYCFASAFALMSTTIGQVMFWTIVLYAGMPISVPLGLLFVMKYVGVKLTKLHYTLLMIVPFISFLMVLTNDWHHLHYRVYEIDPILGAPYIHQEPGPWYLIHGGYTFAGMFVAFILGISRWKETAKEYRPQLVSIVLGQFIPMATAFLYLMGVTPPGFDPVPMVLWVSSVLYVWSISSSRLFMVMPVAKDAIFHSINDGVIVLDKYDRIIEFNQACQEMFPRLNKSLYGVRFENVWKDVSGDSVPFQLTKEGQNQEITLVLNESERVYQIRITSLEQAQVSNGRLLVFTDITELKQLQVKLEHLAYYDELTKIYNRRAFFNQCNRAFLEAKEKGQPFSVILMDIDFFKKVNDTYGHHVGDDVLVHAVAVCQTQINQDGLFARYGGEEFVLALKGHTLTEAEKVANRLRSNLEMHPLITKHGFITITLSLGVAEAHQEENETLYQLLNKADKALYAAKQAGRNRVHVYSSVKEIVGS